MWRTIELAKQALSTGVEEHPLQGEFAEAMVVDMPGRTEQGTGGESSALDEETEIEEFRVSEVGAKGDHFAFHFAPFQIGGCTLTWVFVSCFCTSALMLHGLVP